jgi:diguanylate cyclase (GGDEF)-like protein
VALLCVAAGTVGSLIAAHSIAHSDAQKAREAYPRTAATIASSVKQAVAHDEDLRISGSTFFAGNPKASAAEFDTWVKWAQTLRRYPELERLGLITLVRPAELAAFEAQVTGIKPKTSVTTTTTTVSATGAKTAAVRATTAKTTTKPGSGGLRIVPAGTRELYCLPSVELTRGPRRPERVARDYCAVTHALIASRDSARSIYTSVATGHNKALAIETPVYRGNQPPSTVEGRRAAFVGWLREVLVPGIVLQQALRTHAGYAARLRYKSGTSKVVFTSGPQATGLPSTALNLHNGTTVRISQPAAASAGVLDDSDALRVLVGGILLSVLVGALVFLIGGWRGSGPAAPRRRGPRPREVPNEDLYDQLTGLPNRALMLDRANRMLARASRQSGLLVGALFIDIDWFQDVNEKLGPAAGDQLLGIVAERLEGVIRAHDSVGRLGGDEFVILVESKARGARLDSLAMRVIESLHKPLEIDGFGPGVALTASIGVAFGRYANPEDLLRDAELALTAAKTAGRDRYTLFNANMRSVIEGRGVLEVELNTALQEGQLFLMYEPIFDLATRKVVGMEALVRWRHPAKGLVPPDDFMPLAEESGLIVPIGRWALEEACTRAAAWTVAGQSAGVSVKVTAVQLNRDGFIVDLRRALQQSGIDPALLTLEIAETTVMRDVAASVDRLHEIKLLGVKIAIDEFGSGYAHHSDLQRMPLDFLKVDQGSLASAEDDEYRTWLLQAILIVGRDLSLPVVATGIESREQVGMLQAMGCPMAQGPFLAGPVPADEVIGVLSGAVPPAPALSPSDLPSDVSSA